MSSRQLLPFASTFAATLLLCTTVHAAGLFRAYLDSVGNDADPCTLLQPCRLLPAALNAVADGGEIRMLDSANYGATVTVGKSVSILAVPGALGSVVAKTESPAIRITASGLKVALRNLVLVNSTDSMGSFGVHMAGASTLTIENCLIANLPAGGVYVNGTGTLRNTNTLLRNNGGYAVQLKNGATAEISGTQMLGNDSGGVFAYGSSASFTMATVSDSVISHGTSGVFSYTDVAEAVARIVVTRSTIVGTEYALRSDNYNAFIGISSVAVSSSTITNNSYAWLNAGSNSVIKSLGNNHITDSSTNAGVLTQVALQ